MDAVHERIAVQEQQPATLLGVAIVFQVHLERVQEIGLVVDVMLNEALYRRMQQAAVVCGK